MAVKALVHLRFMKSRRYFVRTNWRYRKHCCENDNGTASARGDLKYHVGTAALFGPSNTSDMPRCAAIARSTAQVCPWPIRLKP